jgi:hypothetical protein
MSRSKSRVRWTELPAVVRDEIEQLAGGRVFGTTEPGSWIILAFEKTDGREPLQLWREDD